MNSPAPRQFHRKPFLHASDYPAQTECEEVMLQVLLAQDGSTTRLLETIGGEKICVHVIAQDVVHELPRELAGSLPGKSFLRRLTTLEAKGHVLLDSISYIAIDVLAESIVRDLQEGVRPIGSVLSCLWTRRTFRSQDTSLLEELWRAVGHPDERASRSSCLHTPDGPCIVLGETFRRGVLSLVPRYQQGRKFRAQHQ